MRKRNSIFTAVGLLIFFLLCLVPAGQAQNAPTQISFAAGVPFQLGLSWTFTSSSIQTPAFNTGGLLYYELVFVPTGTVSGCTLTVDGSTGGSFTTGSLVASQTCTSAGSFQTSSAAYSTLGKVTPTITGSGSVTVYLFGFLTNPGSGGASVSITSPVDGSGYINTDCKVGCSGGPADEASFTQGTTQFTPVGGFYNSSPASLTSGQGGAAQMTPDRSLFVNLNRVGGNTLSLFATLFNAVAATGTATSSAVRVPGFSGYGTLQITGAAITGSPSGCAIALAYQPNTGSPASSTQETVTFTPGNSTQVFPVAPTNPSGDNYVATYSCGAYPSAGTISVTFAPTGALDPCQGPRSLALINLTASGQLVTGATSKQTFVCYLQFALSSTADNVALVEGTGTTCASGTAGMAGGATAATGWNLLANGSVTSGNGNNWAFKTATSADNVCLLASSAAQISGVMQYVQQ